MKRSLVILLCGGLLLTLTGCSYSEVFNNKSDSKQDIGVSDNKVSDTKKQNEVKDGIKVEIGQNIQYDDNYNISFLETSFTQKVEPSNPSTYYSYYEPKDSNNNTFVLLKTTIKNLGTETLDGDKLPVGKLIYDNKYKYNSQLVFEEDDGSDLEGYSWYMDIEPLKTKNIWYMVEVPKEVESNTDKSVSMQYKINGKIYTVKIR